MLRPLQYNSAAGPLGKYLRHKFILAIRIGVPIVRMAFGQFFFEPLISLS
jgi:hypothetical protein